MQVLCKNTNGEAETHCCVCGQGFVMFWERQSRSQRSETLSEIQKTLRNHHRSRKGSEAHPTVGFFVPGGNTAVSVSGVSILGHAPTWAL
jgi:hypothetical protein